MKQPEQQVLEIEGQQVPVRIYTERRANSRVSIGKRGVNIRIPHFLSDSQKLEQVTLFKNWAVKKFRQRPELQQAPKVRNYEDGELFSLRDKTYLLNISSKNTKSSTVKIDGGTIHLRLSQFLSDAERQETISKLLSRGFAKEYHAWIYNRLQALNQRHIRKPILKLRLKYTQSVWGSCSRKGNINISTRLLFAPEEVLDYVLLHELAHLLEANHSHRFWAIVENAMPNYKSHEKWLKVHGKDCDF